jgi:shikimate kinase
MIISLTGFMGCGKSSVGRRLSELLCCPFMDLDDVIVESAGRSIPEIFASEGEAAFRHMELEALTGILSTSESTRPCTLILALGGGTVMTPECAEIVKEQTCCIYLRASIETLMEHLSGEADGRPMLHGNDLRDRITELMSKRSATYEKTAHIIIDTDGMTIEGIASKIVTLI